MIEIRHHRAFWHGTRIDLTISEFKVLCDLVTHAGIDRTYRQLYDAVRGEGFAVGHGHDGHRVNVRGYIKRIRKKFRDVDPAFDEIENYASFGYHWRERVEAPPIYMRLDDG